MSDNLRSQTAKRLAEAYVEDVKAREIAARTARTLRDTQQSVKSTGALVTERPVSVRTDDGTLVTIERLSYDSFKYTISEEV